jgi:hypothetical protein
MKKLDASDTNDKRPEYHMSEEEMLYLDTLIAKHGDDTTSMARDTDTNYMQHSATRLASRIDRMKRFRQSQAEASAPASLTVAPSKSKTTTVEPTAAATSRSSKTAKKSSVDHDGDVDVDEAKAAASSSKKPSSKTSTMKVTKAKN